MLTTAYGRQEEGYQHSSNIIYSAIESVGHLLKWSILLFVFLAVLVILMIEIYDTKLTLIEAVKRKMTVYELNHLWNSKHCFEIKTIKGEKEQDQHFF